jgi:hypothetical protein
MSKSAILLRLIVLFCSAVSLADAYQWSKHEQNPEPNAYKKELSQTQVEWLDKILLSSRGIVYGVFQGFFRHKKAIHKVCLNDGVRDEFADFIHFASYGELREIIYVIDDFGHLWRDNFYDCGFQEIV